MIVELDKNNLDLIKRSFISLEYVEKELSVNPYGIFLLYVENDEVIGYLYYSDIYDRAEINQIEVNSIHRNHGYGKKLMDYFMIRSHYVLINWLIFWETEQQDLNMIVLKENYSCQFRKKFEKDIIMVQMDY